MEKRDIRLLRVRIKVGVYCQRKALGLRCPHKVPVGRFRRQWDNGVFHALVALGWRDLVGAARKQGADCKGPSAADIFCMD